MSILNYYYYYIGESCSTFTICADEERARRPRVDSDVLIITLVPIASSTRASKNKDKSRFSFFRFLLSFVRTTYILNVYIIILLCVPPCAKGHRLGWGPLCIWYAAAATWWERRRRRVGTYNIYAGNPPLYIHIK